MDYVTKATAWVVWLGLVAAAPAQQPVGISAIATGGAVVVESRGGPITYKAVVDPKAGGDISDVRLPADGPVVSRELNDVFYLGSHDDEYTLRGWTGKPRFSLSCEVD